MEVCAFNSGTWKAETGDSLSLRLGCSQDQQGLHSDILSEKR